jgi:arylsulfatase A-like enzyme
MERESGLPMVGEDSGMKVGKAVEIPRSIRRNGPIRQLSLGMLVVLMVCSMSLVGVSEGKRPPNILILIADDLGWRDVGYHGSEIRTPHLDELAAAGVRLERHYVYPTCSPTRAGLLTGRNPSRFGIAGPIAGRSEQTIPMSTPTLASVLRARGYTTALFGKWHLGLRLETGPQRYGFEQSYGYLHGQIDQYTHRYKNGDRSWHRNDVYVDEVGHATDLIADEAVRFVAAKRREPFFLWVAFSVPHYPIQEEERWITIYADSINDPSRRLYAASVTHMDDAIGRIIEALEKKGQLSETVILFMSDNGGQDMYGSETDYEGKHGPYSTLGDNRPLRGWKEDLYEGGIRVPVFVYWRGRLKPSRIQVPVTYLDWFPTFAHLADSKTSTHWKLEGRNVWPLLSAEKMTLPAPTLYWNVGSAAAVLKGDWKLMVHQERPAEVEVYHLREDATESTNLAFQSPAMVNELKSALVAQRRLDP